MESQYKLKVYTIEEFNDVLIEGSEWKTAAIVASDTNTIKVLLKRKPKQDKDE